jgi:hypothetical protein
MESFSLAPLGFEPVIFGMLAHLSDHSAKSHPSPSSVTSVFTVAIVHHYAHLSTGCFTMCLLMDAWKKFNKKNVHTVETLLYY